MASVSERAQSLALSFERAARVVFSVVLVRFRVVVAVGVAVTVVVVIVVRIVPSAFAVHSAPPLPRE